MEHAARCSSSRYAQRVGTHTRCTYHTYQGPRTKDQGSRPRTATIKFEVCATCMYAHTFTVARSARLRLVARTQSKSVRVGTKKSTMFSNSFGQIHHPQWFYAWHRPSRERESNERAERRRERERAEREREQREQAQHCRLSEKANGERERVEKANYSNPPLCTQSEQYQPRLRGQDRRERGVRGGTERVETVEGVARMAAWGGRVGGRVGWSGRRSRKVSPEINRPPFPGQLYSLSLSALSSSLSSLSPSALSLSLPLSALSLLSLSRGSKR